MGTGGYAHISGVSVENAMYVCLPHSLRDIANQYYYLLGAKQPCLVMHQTNRCSNAQGYQQCSWQGSNVVCWKIGNFSPLLITGVLHLLWHLAAITSQLTLPVSPTDSSDKVRLNLAGYCINWTAPRPHTEIYGNVKDGAVISGVPPLLRAEWIYL